MAFGCLETILVFLHLEIKQRLYSRIKIYITKNVLPAKFKLSHITYIIQSCYVEIQYGHLWSWSLEDNYINLIMIFA
jgi:hypothetical protein